MVVLTGNLGILEAEVRSEVQGQSESIVLGQPGLHGETASNANKKLNKNKTPRTTTSI